MITWEPADAVGLRDFLQTKAGSKLLDLIKRPASKAETIEATALNARYADGVEWAGDFIRMLRDAQGTKQLDPGYISWDRDNR